MKSLLLIAGWLCVTPFWAVASPVSMRLSLADVVQGEPAILLLRINNITPARVEIDLGEDRLGNLNFSLRGPKRTDFSRSAVRGRSGLSFFGRLTIDPSSEFTHVILLPDLFDLSGAGEYILTMQFSLPVAASGAEPELYEGLLQTSFTVLPPDAARLEAALASLTERALQSTEAAHVYARALSSVEDPQVVPYLARLASTPSAVQHIPLAALERFPSHEAVDALVAAMASGARSVRERAHASLVRMARSTSDPRLRESIESALTRKREQ